MLIARIDVSFEEALKQAKAMIEKGEARQYALGHDRDLGKFIDLETDQGWHPAHFWQEYEIHDVGGV